MLRLFMMLCTVAVLPLQSIAWEDDPPVDEKPFHAVIPKIDSPITIDATFDEPAWKLATPENVFYDIETGKPVLTDITSVRMLYDDTYLYMAWECLDEDILATYTEKDAHLWDEEVLEFFVAPHEDISRYFELQWNPLATTFDAIINNTLDDEMRSIRFSGDHDWTAEGMKHAVHVDGTVQQSDDTDRGWRVEVAIPFAALESSVPESGDTWRANLYRYSRWSDGRLINQAWSPTDTHYHEPRFFGTLEFVVD